MTAAGETGLLAMAEASALARFTESTPWVEPLSGVLHLVGLVMLLGPVWLLDLRLLGAFRQLPLVALAQAVQPIAASGFLLLVLTGGLMLLKDTAMLTASPVMAWKLAIILLASWNALVSRRRWLGGGANSMPVWLMAFLSIFLWLLVLGLGWLLARQP
ncbi:hypothetical protein ACUJ46_08595 [Sandaracinobacteroides sp. A072]|uniref:hypothetical protein n=1 Tax=Sandaracinobacteroides sp. A072 TaxID=3461146 RepID=UPI0040413B03